MNITLSTLATNTPIESQDDNPFVSFDGEGGGRSRLYDDKWDFTALGQKVRMVSFVAIEQPHRRVIQSIIARWIEHTKAESGSGHFTVATAYAFVTTLNTIVTRFGDSDFQRFDRDRDWSSFKSSLDGIYSKGMLEHFVTAINRLNNLGVTSRRTTNAELAPLAVRDIQQNIALPPEMHAQMLITAVERVEKYHPHRVEIANCFESLVSTARSIYAMRGLTERGYVSKVAYQAKKIARPACVPDLPVNMDGAFVKKIVANCFLVACTFSGARKSELSLMSPDSYHEVNGIPHINGLTSKGNEGVGISVVWQTHPIVKKALELAYDITQYARKVHRDTQARRYERGLIDRDTYEHHMRDLNSAFLRTSIRGAFDAGKELGSVLFTSLSSNTYWCAEDYFNPATEEDVREFNLLNPTREGQLEVGGYVTKFTPHDLRRSFAVFMVRNKLGNGLTVKYQLQHDNLNMSNYYANNAELARIEGMMLDTKLEELFAEAAEDAAVDALDEVYNGSESLSGKEGERIMKSKNAALGRGESVYMSRSQLRALVKSGDKAIVMLPTGAYCTNPSCERLCAISYFNSEDKPCDHEVITKRGANIRNRERMNLIEGFREMNEMNDYAMFRILVGMKEKIIFFEDTLRKHDIEFEPFVDEIKAVVA